MLYVHLSQGYPKGTLRDERYSLHFTSGEREAGRGSFAQSTQLTGGSPKPLFGSSAGGCNHYLLKGNLPGRTGHGSLWFVHLSCCRFADLLPVSVARKTRRKLITRIRSDRGSWNFPTYQLPSEAGSSPPRLPEYTCHSTPLPYQEQIRDFDVFHITPV